jgi:hypothetical protein
MKLNNWAEKWWQFWLVLEWVHVISSPGDYLDWQSLCLLVMGQLPGQNFQLGCECFLPYLLKILLELVQYIDQDMDRISVKLLLYSHWYVTDLYCNVSRLCLGCVQWVSGLFPMSKKTKEWSRQLNTCSAKVKNECNFNYSLPPIYLHDLHRKKKQLYFCNVWATWCCMSWATDGIIKWNLNV